MTSTLIDRSYKDEQTNDRQANRYREVKRSERSNTHDN